MSWRKVWSRVLVACMAIMMLGTSVRADNSIGFTDVRDDAYYAEAIRWAIGQGITNGIGNNQFGVGQTVTRAQAVTFLWRSAGKPTPKTQKCPFVDVEGDKNNSWYKTAVLWAVENGITNGTSATTFSPNDPVTRGQLITFLYRTKGGETQSGAAWYTAAEQWATSKGLLVGTAKTYATNAECPREDVVFYIWKEMQSGNSGDSGSQSSDSGEVEIDYGDGSEGGYEYEEGDEDVVFG